MEQEIEFSSTRPQRLLQHVTFHLEDYDPISRDVSWRSSPFYRDAGQYIDNKIIGWVCKTFNQVAVNPVSNRERTRIVMSKSDARFDVTNAFLTLKACADRGETIQIGLLGDLDCEDIETQDALAAVYRPSTVSSRKLVDIQLRTTGYSDMRTRARKNSHITLDIEVLVAGNARLYSSFSLPISQDGKGSWSASIGTNNPALLSHNAAHIEQFSQKIGVNLIDAERFLRDHALLSLTNLERYRHTGDGNVPDVIADSAMQIDQDALSARFPQ